MSQILNLEAIDRASLSREPFSFLMGSDFLKHEEIGQLRQNFPNITKPGYLTVDEVALKGRFRDLINELEGSELTEKLSQRFGLDLHPYPRLTTIMRQSQLKYGPIHTDGPSKVMTMLVYMNDTWNPAEGGCLRALYDGKHFEPFAAEVQPLMGNVFAFLRSDNSWHGHKPFAGERKVVQIAWIKDAAELARKKKRNSVAQFFKGIFGR